MFSRLLKTALIVVTTMAAAVLAFGGGSAPAVAQCGGSCGDSCGHAGHPAHDSGSTAHQHGHPASGAWVAPPHGGQLTTAEPLSFEVVYLPQEIRVYLFGIMPYSVSAKDVMGEVFLQLRNDQRATRVVLHYVAQPAGQQDYLAAPVYLSRVKEGDLTATVRLANLPLQNRPGISFSQAVVISKMEPQVVSAAIDPSDQAGVARQGVCPVTGAPLDSMGGPVKVIVGGQPLYLCCEGCLGKVKSDPDAYLRKIGDGLR